MTFLVLPLSAVITDLSSGVIGAGSFGAWQRGTTKVSRLTLWTSHMLFTRKGATSESSYGLGVNGLSGKNWATDVSKASPSRSRAAADHLPPCPRRKRA